MNKLKELNERNRFFIEICNKPYAVRIYEHDRHFKYESAACGDCGHHVFTECTAKQIPEEWVKGLHFYPEVFLEGDSNFEMHFSICDSCGKWHKKDFVQIIGGNDNDQVNINCRFSDCVIEVTSDLAKKLELVFWDMDVEDCLILYRIRNGNREYLDRISGDALTKEERKTLFEAIGKVN